MFCLIRSLGRDKINTDPLPSGGFILTMKNNSSALAFILGLGIFMYVFSPQAGLISPAVVEENQAKVLTITIKERTLADPRQSDLRVKIGERAVLHIETDEDGRIDLHGGDRNVFNPVFSGTINTLTIPTDRSASLQIEFHPGARPNNETEGLLIGAVVVER